MSKLTRKELETIEKIFDNPLAEILYGGNELSYIREVEAIKNMSEEELREKYPTAYYWIDKWSKERLEK